MNWVTSLSLQIIVLCLIAMILNASCQREKDIRLSGRKGNLTAGAVEVFYNGSWAYLCDSQLRMEEGNVICRQLGFSGVKKLFHGLTTLSTFGYPDYVLVLQQQVTCNGSEASLLHCNFAGPMVNACIIIDMAGVYCQPPLEVQLVGSTDPHVGIVEIPQNGRPSVICDDDWTRFDASVICRSLGFNYALSVPPVDVFNRSSDSGGVMISIDCIGSEDGLSECSSTPALEISNGSCSTSSRTAATVNCTTQLKQRRGDEIRLVDGEFPGEGRVEVAFLGEWFRLSCYFYPTRETAEVLCRQLGYTYLVMRDRKLKHFLSDQLPLYFRLNCHGNETSIADCPSEVQSYCFNDNDLTIICSSAEPAPPGSIIRLMQGTTPYEGRVEVRVGNRWGTICTDDAWDINAANVVCRQLGYEPAIAAPKRAYFGSNTMRSYLDAVVCNGTENDLSLCQFRGPEEVSCNQLETAGVICGNNYTVPRDYEVRLVGSAVQNEGRVEIGYQGRWGGICRDNFQSPEASVICLMLGYIRGISYSQEYGSSEGSVVLSDVACSGRESHILDCDHRGPPGECQSGNLAGIYCIGYHQQFQDFDARIGEGESLDGGRAEVYYNGSWGYMCYSSLNERIVEVMCNQLGYADKYFTLSSYGRETYLMPSPLILHCTWNETRLSECKPSLNKTVTETGCDELGIAVVNCDDFYIPVQKPPNNNTLVIKAVSIGVLLFVGLVTLVLSILRKVCRSPSAEGTAEASQVTTTTGTYTSVCQTDQNDLKENQEAEV